MVVPLPPLLLRAIHRLVSELELELTVVVVDETVWLTGEEDEEPKCFELEEPGVPVLVSLSDGGISIY